MPAINKLYVAFFYEKGKHPFATNRVVAKNFHDAEDLATLWGTSKYGQRLKAVKVEKSKGEVIAYS